MKKALIFTLTAILSLCLTACGPAEQIEPSPLPSEEIIEPSPAEETWTPPPVTPTPAPRTAEEVLPPIEKDIFAGRDDFVYVQSFSAGPDGCAVILSDGRMCSFGETMLPYRMERDEDGQYQISDTFDNAAYVHCSQFDALAIDNDGILWGWGMVRGCGNIIHTTDVDGPLRLMTDVQMASAAVRNYLALRKDGTVWMWGSGESGLLGNGPEHMKYSSANPLLEPVKVLEDIIWAEMNGARCYAIDKDNALWTWGNMGKDPESGESVYYDSPVRVMEDVKYAGGILVVKTDGSLWSLELNGEGALEPAHIMDGVKYAKGGIRFMVIKNDGSLWVWGDNFNGSLGNGTDEYIPEPMKILDDVVYAVSGMNNIYALKSNGELWESGRPYGTPHYLSDEENAPTKEEFFLSCLPHKILDGVLVK